MIKDCCKTLLSSVLPQEMWMNNNQQLQSIPHLGKWTDVLNKSFNSSLENSVGSIALATQQKKCGPGPAGEMKTNKDKQMKSHRPLSRTTSCGLFARNDKLQHSALNQHRALQRASSYDGHRLDLTLPEIASLSYGLPSSVRSVASGINTSSNGYRSRETGVIEKLLLSYGFIRCADREGRLFFHYSQFNGEANSLSINDEVEFDVSMDTRTGKPVAIQVVKLKKGTVVFEVYSEERILGEITNSAAQQSCIQQATDGLKPNEKPILNKYGSLCYSRMGEVFFLPYTENDLTNKDIQLNTGDKVSFYIATEKRTGILRSRKITLVERAPPRRFVGIVTAMKESFGFIERADLVKEIFFHYSEVSNHVPDLHIGDHVEYSVQDRNSKEVATNVRLLPMGSVQLEEISDKVFVGTVEKPLPPKAVNKPNNNLMNNAGGDATNISKLKGNLLASQQPVVTLAGIIQYTTPLNEERKIRFGEKDRAANCIYTLLKGDKVSFFTVTDKRNGQQRAAGVNLLLEETLQTNGEKREQGIVAAVKEGFGFIKCLERDSRLFFHCCELLDHNHCIRMSDEVEFTVLDDPVAEKHRLHATRITILPKGTVIFHVLSDYTCIGVVELLPGTPANLSADYLVSPALGPNPGLIVYEDKHESGPDNRHQIAFQLKELTEWMEASSIEVGSIVEFRICMLKRSGARYAVEIRLQDSALLLKESTAIRVRNIVSSLTSLDLSNTKSEKNTVDVSPTCTPSILTTISSPEKLAEATEDVSGSPSKMSPEHDPPVEPTPTTPEQRKSNPVTNAFTNAEKETQPANALSNTENSVSTADEKVLGWISTLKETFGFIETADHSSEIFFHFSELQDSHEKYNINTPVRYQKGMKEDKVCALNVAIANENENMFHEEIISDGYTGIIVRSPKSGNASQASYQGKIEYKCDEEDSETKQILFSPLSLNDRRDFIQTGDRVSFQICSDTVNNTMRAVNIVVRRQVIQATVESIKGEYGFINHEVKNNDTGASGKLFFHMSEVREGADQISVGSLVQFSVVFNQRTGKHSAVSISCLGSNRQRPERLRLRSSCEPGAPVVAVKRQPRGPDSSKGFSLRRRVESCKFSESSVLPETE